MGRYWTVEILAATRSPRGPRKPALGADHPPQGLPYGPLIEWVQRGPLHTDVLGHSLHPSLTDVTIGCWLGTSLLDLVGGSESRRGAALLAGFGLLASCRRLLPAPLTGGKRQKLNVGSDSPRSGHGYWDVSLCGLARCASSRRPPGRHAACRSGEPGHRGCGLPWRPLSFAPRNRSPDFHGRAELGFSTQCAPLSTSAFIGRRPKRGDRTHVTALATMGAGERSRCEQAPSRADVEARVQPVSSSCCVVLSDFERARVRVWCMI